MIMSLLGIFRSLQMMASRLGKLYQPKSFLTQFYLREGILERWGRPFTADGRVERSPF
jgi:hypothetical protein